jgi:hypothetical protein
MTGITTPAGQQLTDRHTCAVGTILQHSASQVQRAISGKAQPAPIAGGRGSFAGATLGSERRGGSYAWVHEPEFGGWHWIAAINGAWSAYGPEASETSRGLTQFSCVARRQPARQTWTAYPSWKAPVVRFWTPANPATPRAPLNSPVPPVSGPVP